MRHDSMINRMFQKTEHARNEVPRLEPTPLQEHILKQFAHAVSLWQTAQNDPDLRRLVEVVIAARYRDCIAQEVAAEAQAMMAKAA